MLALVVSCIALALSIGAAYYALKTAKYSREAEAIYRSINQAKEK